MELLGKEKEVVGIYISAHPLDDFKNELKFCNANLSYFKEDLAKFVGMNLSFAGIVTDVQHRVSKAGKGWATFIIEDYNDSHEFRIFGEEYMKYRHFLMPSSFLFVKTVVKPGWTNKDGVTGEPRMQFIDFKLLHDIMDEMCKKITIQLPLHEVTEDKVKDLQHLFVTNSGKQQVIFTVWDGAEKIELNITSRNTKVNITNELLSTLDKEQIAFKLN